MGQQQYYSSNWVHDCCLLADHTLQYAAFIVTGSCCFLLLFSSLVPCIYPLYLLGCWFSALILAL